jgi:hypothetical protein
LTSPANANVTAWPLPRGPPVVDATALVDGELVDGELVDGALVDLGAPATDEALLPSSRLDTTKTATPITTSNTRPAIAYRLLT